MAFEWKLIFDALKLPTRFVVPAGLSLGVLLFAPDWALGRIGFSELRHQKQPYLGAAFLFCCCLIASRCSFWIAAWARENHRFKMAHNRSISYLKNLTPKEQELLRRYIEQHSKSVLCNTDTGVTFNLVQNQIISISSDIGNGTLFAHNISDWSWQYLHEHPDLVGLPINFTYAKQI